MDGSPNAVGPVPSPTAVDMHDEVSLMEELLMLRQENEKQKKKIEELSIEKGTDENICDRSTP